MQLSGCWVAVTLSGNIHLSAAIIFAHVGGLLIILSVLINVAYKKYLAFLSRNNVAAKLIYMEVEEKNLVDFLTKTIVAS